MEVKVFRVAPSLEWPQKINPNCSELAGLLEKAGFLVSGVYLFDLGRSKYPTMLVVLDTKMGLGSDTIKVTGYGKLWPLLLSEPGNLILRDADFKIVVDDLQPDESYGEHWDKVKPLLETDPKHLDLLYRSGDTWYDSGPDSGSDSDDDL